MALLEPSRAAHLAARIGRVLFVNGADSQHVSRAVAGVAGDMGHAAHVLVTSEAVLVTVGTNEQFCTKVGQAFSSPSVNMGRLTAVNELLEEVKLGELDADAIEGRLDDIEASRGRYPVGLVVLGVTVTTAALTKLFGATWAVVAASLVSGLVSALLRRWMPSVWSNQFGDAFVVAILSGLTAVIVLRFYPDESPVLALTAAGMILVPGVPLINGVREVTSGYAGNGVARLTTGIATVLAIGFALFTVSFVTGAVLPVNAAPGSLQVPEDLLFAGLAAVGFALLFNVPPKAICFCVIAGMTSHGLRTLFEHAGLALPISSLLGALSAGLIARLGAQIHDVPAVAFAFPGVVALIPGSYGFRAGIAGLQIMAQGAEASPALVATMLSLIITTIVTTSAIAIGLVLAFSGPAQDGRRR
ncbi:threonine/serine ThrE exporter family protein [Neorhizobium vignae]|uniref:threonine/serine ThrE exporter family protein n=1 Tax=Neorhizobium vignae TaxID=690585 RepID=UPI00055E4BFE|nr:threonine/serine exporter family protein [Neorhizobium vignae]